MHDIPTDGAVDALPWAVDWFINRSNAGDIDSVFTTIAPGAVVVHAGVTITCAEVIGEFFASPWFIGGYIHLRIRGWTRVADTWRVVIDVDGAHSDLRDAGRYVFAFTVHAERRTIQRLEVTRSEARTPTAPASR